MTIYTETTVEDLLTFIETDLATHDIDPSECDCNVCHTWNSIAWWTVLRSEK